MCSIVMEILVLCEGFWNRVGSWHPMLLTTLIQASLQKWAPPTKTMLVGPISSSLFTLASKRNQVRVGYENVGFVRGCCFKQLATPLLEPNLVAPIFHQFHQPDVSYSHRW